MQARHFLFPVPTPQITTSSHMQPFSPPPTLNTSLFFQAWLEEYALGEPSPSALTEGDLTLLSVPPNRTGESLQPAQAKNVVFL